MLSPQRYAGSVILRKLPALAGLCYICTLEWSWAVSALARKQTFIARRVLITN
jgi:hypothetical protein